jgi:hypothetical protein
MGLIMVQRWTGARSDPSQPSKYHILSSPVSTRRSGRNGVTADRVVSEHPPHQIRSTAKM